MSEPTITLTLSDYNTLRRNCMNRQVQWASVCEYLAKRVQKVADETSNPEMVALCKKLIVVLNATGAAATLPPAVEP